MSSLILISISTRKGAEGGKEDCKNIHQFHQLWNKAMSFKSLPGLLIESKKIW